MRPPSGLRQDFRLYYKTSTYIGEIYELYSLTRALKNGLLFRLSCRTVWYP